MSRRSVFLRSIWWNLVPTVFWFLAGCLGLNIDLQAQDCVIPPSGLIGWWPGEGNANARIGGIQGRPVGDAAHSLGKVGFGFRFDGDGDGIVLGSPPALQLQVWSIEAWVKRSSPTQSTLDGLGPGVILGFGSGGYAFALENDGRLLMTQVGRGGVWSQFTFRDLEWHHVVVTKSSGNILFYLDGAQSLAQQYSPVFQFSGEAMIGALSSGRVSSSFLGQIDEVSVYSRALASEEVQTIFAAGTAGKCVPPVVTIRLDPRWFTDTTVVTMTSSDPNGVIRFTLDGNYPSAESKAYDGAFTLTNTTIIRAQHFAGTAPRSDVAVATVIRSTPELECVPTDGLVGWWSADQSAIDLVAGGEGQLRGEANYAPGLLGQAFSMNQAGAGVILDQTSSLRLQTFTIASWIKRRDAIHASFGSANGVVFGFGPGGFGFGFGDDGRMFLSVLGTTMIWSTVTVSDTNWHHVAVTKVGNAVVFYVDGNRDIALQYDGQFSFDSSAAIGAAGNLTATFNGMIDETRVYSRGLNASEIVAFFSGVAYRRCAPAEVKIRPDPGLFAGSAAVTLESSDTNGLIRFTLDGTAPTASSRLYDGQITLTNTTLLRARAYSDTAPISPVRSATFVRSGDGAECVSTQGLVGWWTADFGGTDAASHTEGQFVNGATLAPGKLGRAFNFNQAGAALLVQSPALRLQTFTIAGWVKRTAGNGADAVLFGSSEGGYVFGLGGDGRLFVSLLGRNAIWSTLIVPDEDWHHVAVAKVGGTVNFYLDGQLDTTLQYDVGFTLGSPATLGSAPNLTATFYGLIDEWRIYSRWLDAAEIKTLFSAEGYRRCVPAELTISPNSSLFTGSALVTLASNETNGIIRFTLDGTPPSASSPSYDVPLAITNNTIVRAQVYSGAAPISDLAFRSFIRAGTGQECVTTNGLVAWWPAERSAIDFVAGSDGRLVNGVTYSPGKLGSAFSFDQAGAAVFVGNARFLQLQTFTIASWIKRGDLARTAFNGGDGVIFGFGPDGFGFGLNSAGSLFLSQLSRSAIQSTTAVTDTDWHHVAVTKDGDAVIFFVDGVPGDAYYYNVDFTFQSSAAIGSAGNLTATFRGSIDELRIYRRKLEATEVRAIFSSEAFHRCVPAELRISPPGGHFTNSVEVTFVTKNALNATVRYTLDGSRPTSESPEFSGPITLTNSTVVRAQTFDGSMAISPMAEARYVTLGCAAIMPGLIGWWPGNQSAVDLIGGNDGALRGDTRYVEGSVGSAFEFDGQGDGVVLTNSAAFGLQVFTIEAWVKRSQLDASTRNGSTGVLFGYGSGGYTFGMDKVGRLVLTKVGSSSVVGRSAVGDTHWHHVAVVRSGPTTAFYLDGVLDATLEYAVQFEFNSPAGIGALATDLASSFLGAIDELSIYSRPLTAEEILRSVAASGKCADFAPQIVVQPQPQFVEASSNAVFEVRAAGTLPLRFRWELDGNLIEGATNSVLLVSNVTSSVTGKYRVAVSNALGMVTSEPAKLTIVVRPKIIREPQNQTATVGSSVQFSVSATGAPPLTYQWFANGRAIAGAMSPLLIVSNLRLTNSAVYTVRVGNSIGSVLSAPATLKVGSGTLTLLDGGARVLLGVVGEAGANYAIDISSDLVTWSQLATVLNAGSTWQFEDPTALGVTQRFYRLRRN